jgi:mono/diheme cytochrome c family protein
MNQQPGHSAENFPLVPLLVLFGTIMLLLVLALGGQAEFGHQIALKPTASPVEPTQTGPTSTPTPIPPRETPTPQQVASAALDPQMISRGETIFQGLCVACHGFNARGISGLGKTLIGSEFINSSTDDELHAFLLVGRPIQDPLNTTGVAMPPKGGNPGLTGDDLYDVIAYIRSLNSVQVASAPTTAPTLASTPSGPTLTPTEFVAPSLGGSSAAEETETADTAPDLFLTSGEVAYVRSCSACHGVHGEGVEYFGPALAESQLLLDRNGIGLIEFLTAEKPPVDPRVAYPHPYRGGYPVLSDEQIRNIVAYLYQLVGEK